jgi:hypothetical protein
MGGDGDGIRKRLGKVCLTRYWVAIFHDGLGGSVEEGIV